MRRLTIEKLESRTFLSAGSPDPTFGANGVAFFTAEPGSFRDIVPVADGKLVAIGNVGTNEQPSLLWARYNRNGTLDTAFGGDGYETLATPPNFGLVEAASLQPDGKIVVLGFRGDLTRLTADLQLDTTFGTGGFVSPPALNNASIGGGDVLVQGDGEVVAAATLLGRTGSRPDVRAVIRRFNPDGSPDTTFSGDGVTVVDMVPGLGSEGGESVTAVTLLPDGRILVGSSTIWTVGVGTGWALAALTSGGELDPGFGENGVAHVLVPSPNAPLLLDVLPLPDGRFVVSGSWNSPQGHSHDMLLARFRSDGSPDVTFGNSGFARAGFSDEVVADGRRVARQADGKIVVGGPVVKGPKTLGSVPPVSPPTARSTPPSARAGEPPLPPTRRRSRRTWRSPRTTDSYSPAWALSRRWFACNCRRASTTAHPRDQRSRRRGESSSPPLRSWHRDSHR
jgi:uncharacterized delta-60 repeat protein